MSKTSKLSNYVQISDVTSAAAQVKCNLDKGKRALISQIRCGILPLQIQLGRYQGLPRHERICKLCNNDVEDEIHFLFNCSKLQNQHVKLYDKVPELLHIENLVSRFENLCNCPFIFGNFIEQLWYERNKIINEN